jgi:hypothetical protein
MSGRGMGVCAENNTAGFARRGCGFGRGAGRGFRNRFVQPVQPAQSTELSELKEQMTRIEKRLGELQA